MISPCSTPLTRIEHAYEYRFAQPPDSPQFGVRASIASLLSLVVMTVQSVIMLMHLRDPSQVLPGQAPLAVWAWLPFALTSFGAGLGGLFELYLLLAGTPFQQTRSRATTFVFRIRLLNLAPVTASILFFIVCMVVHDPMLRAGMLVGAGALTFALAMALFYGGPSRELVLVMLGLQALGAVIVLLAALPIGGVPVLLLLLALPLLQVLALTIGAATPLRSAAFHLLATTSGVAMFCALLLQSAAAPNFSQAVAVPLRWGSPLFWAFIAACVGGLLFTSRVSPRTYNNFRATLSNAFWSTVYFVLVGGIRFPKPRNLSSIYSRAPEPIGLRPYYVQHAKFVRAPLSIPASERFEASVLALPGMVERTRRLFSLVARLDRWLPQVDSAARLADKPRLAVWSSGADYWPWIFRKRLFGLTLPVSEPEHATPVAIAAYKAGQQLAHMCESGIGATLLVPGRRAGELMLDLRRFEVYETKPDYEPYGGQAFFHIDPDAERLVLHSVIAPRSIIELPADPEDASFRRAEAMIVATLYCYEISGKHLVEIHMTYNLVEVALHNAFEAQGQWMHPIRTVLYLHLFSHQLAEELTTQHLVQEGAVFTQIFATTHSAMINQLNDRYRESVYGSDEDFRSRAEMFSIPAEHGRRRLLPHAAITWELEYVRIWTRYADALIDIIYPDDAAVLADRALQDFHCELERVLPNRLPARYAKFGTKAGVSCFVSDTIHHLVVRHQVYGTASAPGLDHRIATTQVPRDGGTSGVDEWRALAAVSLATAHARFVPLLGDFKYLLDGVDATYRQPMRRVFDQLQADLRALEARWNSTPEDRAYNRNYLRVVPSELRTGPGF